MKGLDITVESTPAAQIVHVRGEVDLESSPRLWQQLQRAFQGTRPVKVDLHAVDYIDSSGIAVLVQGLKLAGKRSVGFSLREPSARVMAVLELAQLPRLFTIERVEPTP